MGKVKKFQTKEDKLKSWTKEVLESVPEEATSVLVIFGNDEQSWTSYYNCDSKQIGLFKLVIDELHFDRYLCKNIGRYIEYVE